MYTRIRSFLSAPVSDRDWSGSLRLALALLIADLAAVLTGLFVGAAAVAGERGGVSFWACHAALQERSVELAALSAALILLLGSSGHYARAPSKLRFRGAVLAVAFVAVLDAAVQQALRGEVSRLWLVSAWSAVGVSMMVNRALIWAIWFAVVEDPICEACDRAASTGRPGEVAPISYAEKRVEFAAKRCLDYALASVALVVLAPLLMLLASVLAFEKGPILHRQLRVGRNGSRFVCLKFRSMRPDAEAELERVLKEDPAARASWQRFQKICPDPRVTPVGAFLRETSLDELPQLFNVLRGEMSLVGPRPIVAPEVSGYGADRAYLESSEFKFYRACLPGITGLWQVSGRAGTTHSRRIFLDGVYARKWSLGMDLLILLRTVGVVFRRTGS